MRDVEFSVGTEGHSAAHMNRGVLVVAIKNNLLASFLRKIRICHARRVTHYDIVRRDSGGGIVDVDVTVGGVTGIDRDPDQSSFRKNLGRNYHEGSGKKSACLENAELARLLTNEKPSIRSRCHAGRAGESADHLCFGEPRGQRSGQKTWSGRDPQASPQ